jgi:hypothetical protein
MGIASLLARSSVETKVSKVKGHLGLLSGLSGRYIAGRAAPQVA